MDGRHVRAVAGDDRRVRAGARRDVNHRYRFAVRDSLWFSSVASHRHHSSSGGDGFVDVRDPCRHPGGLGGGSRLRSDRLDCGHPSLGTRCVGDHHTVRHRDHCAVARPDALDGAPDHQSGTFLRRARTEHPGDHRPQPAAHRCAAAASRRTGDEPAAGDRWTRFRGVPRVVPTRHGELRACVVGGGDTRVGDRRSPVHDHRSSPRGRSPRAAVARTDDAGDGPGNDCRVRNRFRRSATTLRGAEFHARTATGRYRTRRSRADAGRCGRLVDPRER